MFKVVTAIFLAIVAQEASAVKIPAALEVVSFIFRLKFVFSKLAGQKVNHAVDGSHAAQNSIVTNTSLTKDYA